MARVLAHGLNKIDLSWVRIEIALLIGAFILAA
jgi:hypothetical protein